VEVVAAEGGPSGDVLRLAASLDQASPHVLAAAVVRGAHEQELELSLPTDVEEVTGEGVRGRVDGRPVATGKLTWLSAGVPPPPWARAVARRAARDGLLTVFIRVEDRIAGAALLDDPIRPDARRTLRQLRRDGIRRIVMVTGDRTETALSVGTALGVDEVLAERSPAEKVAAVQAEQRNGRTIMVGDGINDAPALAVADVGVAMATGGSSASSDAADVVLTVDRLARLGDAMRIARRSRRIAVQSVAVGMTLSALAMVVAALGWLPPTAGAVAQEGIDLVAILNALRAVRTPKDRNQLAGEGATLGRQYAAEHRRLRPGLGQLHSVADDLSAPLTEALLERLRLARAFLVDQILPHELEEDTTLYPVLARAFGGRDATGTMSRAHAEINHLIRRFDRLVDAAEARWDDAGVDDDVEEVNELRSALYGLHAILKLHFEQEDEEYFSLLPDMTGHDRAQQHADV
jgi:soluble P-type ATPase